MVHVTLHLGDITQYLEGLKQILIKYDSNMIVLCIYIIKNNLRS